MDTSKAVKQTEFYFTDTNLPYDKFMWTLYSKDPEHWVPLQTVASFKRMRDFSAQGLEWLANAIRAESTFLEVDETGTKIRRTTEPQEPKNVHDRSVYAKGFGEEDSTLQTRLEDFFNKYGQVDAVRMRRDEKKKFKGSVFAEFQNFESVDAFLKADPKPSWNSEELVVMTKEDYCQMKVKEKGLTGKAAIHRKELIASRGSNRGFNAFRDAKSSSGTKTEGGGDEQEDGKKKDVYLDFLGHKLLIQQDAEGNGSVEESDIPYVKGVTLKFEGCGGDVKWPEIKDPIKANFDGRAPYIKYQRGDDSGLVGFYKPLSEEDIEYVKNAIKTINEHEVKWSVAEEEEEKQFEIERAKAAAKNAFNQTSFSSSSRDSRSNSNGSRGRGRGRGRGGRGGRGGGRGGGGRGGGRDRDGGGSRNAEKKAAGEGGGEEATGEKRKRAIELDGGPDVGVRGTVAPPSITREDSGTQKKVKTNDGAAVAAE